MSQIMEEHDSGNKASGREPNPPRNTAGDKGKQKEEPTLADRMQSSAALFLGSLSQPASGSSEMAESKSSVGRSGEHARLQSTLHETASFSGSKKQELQSFGSSSQKKSADDEFRSFQEGPDQSPFQPAIPHGSLQRQEAMDGAGVLELLDKPHELDGALGAWTAEEVEEQLTPEERERLRKALFTNDRAAPSWDKLLEPSEPPAGEGSIMFDQEWKDVFATYTDDVWGDLGPLAAAARAEVIGEPDEPRPVPAKDPQALARLRLVLAHLRGG